MLDVSIPVAACSATTLASEDASVASFSHTLPVSVSVATLWTLVRDVQRIAAIFPYTTVEQMETPEPDCWRFWRQLAIPNLAELRWHEEARVTADGELRFAAIAGDLHTFSGRWCVSPAGSTAVLSLSLEYEIPAAVAPKMPPLLVGYVMGEIFKTICQRIKEAAEEDQA